MLPELVRRLGLPQDFGALGGGFQGAAPDYGPTVMGAYEDPFPAPPPIDMPMADTGGFPQAPARVDPRAALLAKRNQAFQGLRSAVDQPPVKQPVPNAGLRDPKKAAIMAAIALISQMFNKGGEFGQGLLGGYVQGQDALNQQDYATQVASANAEAQNQKVKQALAEMMLQEANMGLGDYDRQEQQDYGRREDARKEFLADQKFDKQLKLQMDQIEYGKLKEKEQADRQLQDDLRAEARDFGTRYANAKAAIGTVDEAFNKAWSKQREQMKLRGIPGEWLTPIDPVGTKTLAASGQDMRGEQFDWTKGIRQEYLDIAKDRANRSETQVPKEVAAKRAAIAKADERIRAARKERELLLEAGPDPEEGVDVFGKLLRVAIASEVFEMNQKRSLMGLAPIKAEDYMGEIAPWTKALQPGFIGGLGKKVFSGKGTDNALAGVPNPGKLGPGAKPSTDAPGAGAGFEAGWRATEAKIKAAYAKRDKAAAKKALAEFKSVYGVPWKPNERFR